MGFRSIGILRDLPVCKFGLCLRKQYLVVQILLTRPHKQYIVLQYFVYEFYLSILSIDLLVTKFLNVGPLSVFVRISASYSFVFIWLSCIVLFVTCSLTK